MPLIGTAGHVDHGKSTLVERLTGRDPDRWHEEKQRGLTIDLGFAWAELPGGTEVSFVDVPGHERFLKNMLAGIEAVDVALFVVAADEGWKPQSEEHLAVLDLLQVARGVVALTKVDVVDAELAELAAEEVAISLDGTTLEGSPIIPVSAVTGAGVTELADALAAALPPEPEPNGRPRLWVDRSFPISGAGTVVTGTLLAGEISVDDRIEVYPAGLIGRIRSIQSHERSHERVGPGRRVALNIGGVSHNEISRGDMIGLPEQWENEARLVVSLRATRFVDDIDRRGAYQLHAGSAATRAEITGIDDGIAVLKLAEPLPFSVGDRYILRDTGRQLVVGGGRVLDPRPSGTKRALDATRAIDPTAEADEIADVLLAIRERDSMTRLEAHSGGGRPGNALIAGDEAVSSGMAGRLVDLALELVQAEHRDHPLRPGLPLATLAGRLGVGQPLTEMIVDRGDALQRVGPDVMAAGHTVDLTESQEADWARAEQKLSESLAVPVESDLGVDQEVIAAKIREGVLLRIAPGMVYLTDQIEEIKSHLAECADEFTVAQFRDVSGLTRKYAVPILEWCDVEGLTVRRGDLRSLR